MGIQLTECDCKNLIHLDQDRAQWQPDANTVMNLQGLQKTGYFFFFSKESRCYISVCTKYFTETSDKYSR